MSKLPYVLILTLFTTLPACDDDISSSSRLRRVRLLAVQAEPPNPAFGQTTRLRPLVYVPAGQSVTYEWSWCPAPTSSDDGYKCPVDQATVDGVAAQAGLSGIPPLFLGTTESIEFTNPFPAALLASLCMGDSTATDLFLGSAQVGRNRQVFACARATLPVQVMLTIRGSITDTGVFSLRFPIDETTQGNANPIINGIDVLLPESVRPLDDSGLVTVPREKKVKLVAEVEPSQAETYLDRQLGPDDAYMTDGAGNFILGPTVERLNISWFSEGGGFVESTTGWGVRDLDSNGQPVPFTSATEHEWSTPKVEDYAANSSLILVVVRDSRGGVSWSRGVATLEGAQ